MVKPLRSKLVRGAALACSMALLVPAIGAVAAAAAESAATAASGSPDAPEPEGWAYDLADELMSPFCPGRTLAECPSPQAADLRMWLVTQEAAGASREEVEAILYDRFGDVIRPTPRPEGWGLTAYVIPVLAFLAGGGLVWVFLTHVRRGSRGEPGGSASAAGDEAALERLVDEEIARSQG